MNIKWIDDRFSVSPQVVPADLAAIKAAGFVAIINNRPDGEEEGQPEGDAVEAAALSAGLGYFAIPVGRDGVQPDHIASTRKVIDSQDGPVLAYCRSGTRSTTLWALSQAGRRPPQEIVAAAAGAGYDISHLVGHLGSV